MREAPQKVSESGEGGDSLGIFYNIRKVALECWIPFARSNYQFRPLSH